MSTAANSITQADRDLLATSWSAGAMLRFMDAELTFPDADTVRCDLLQVRPHHRGGIGSAAINGGVIAWFFDITIGCSAVLAPPLRRSATIEVSMKIERALRGDKLRCEAKLDHTTTSILFVNALVTDQHGQICARAKGLVKLGSPVGIEEWSHALGPEAMKAMT